MDEIIDSYPPNVEYPSYYHVSYIEKMMEEYHNQFQPLSVDELKQKFAHYIGGENYTYDQLDTREQDTLEWVLKELK